MQNLEHLLQSVLPKDFYGSGSNTQCGYSTQLANLPSASLAELAGAVTAGFGS